MGNKILIIGVGSAGVKVADKMNLPNSKKIFVDSGTYHAFDDVVSEGEQIALTCKAYGNCSGFCRCYCRPDFCKEVAEEYKDEIKEYIKSAFEEEDINNWD